MCSRTFVTREKPAVRSLVRYVLAIMALAFSGVLLLLGIGQRTFLAGPAEIVYPVAVEPGTNYAVIAGDEFSQVTGQANLVMSGETAFVAIANTRDIEGWVAPFDHSDLSIDAAQKQVTSDTVAGVAPESDLVKVDDEGNAVPLDPRGSDLWLETRTGESSPIRLAVAMKADQSILIAGAEGGEAPTDISIEWVQDRSTPWAGPLLAAGALFAVIGAVLYLLAFDRDRRALGPRRGRTGPLLGVRNVFGGRGRQRRASGVGSESLVPDEPQRGALSGAPELPAGSREPEPDDAPSRDIVNPDTDDLEAEAVESADIDEAGENEAPPTNDAAEGSAQDGKDEDDAK